MITQADISGDILTLKLNNDDYTPTYVSEIHVHLKEVAYIKVVKVVEEECYLIQIGDMNTAINVNRTIIQKPVMLKCGEEIKNKIITLWTTARKPE
jgi:hypothetical protein